MKSVSQTSMSMGTGTANIEVHIVREDGAIDLIHINDVVLGVDADSMVSTAEVIECEGMVDDGSGEPDRAVQISIKARYSGINVERVKDPTPVEGS